MCGTGTGTDPPSVFSSGSNDKVPFLIRIILEQGICNIGTADFFASNAFFV